MARSELSSDFREIMKTAQKQGWGVDQTKSKHWRFTPPSKATDIVIFSGSPGDFRAIKNFVAKMRRSGLKLKR